MCSPASHSGDSHTVTITGAMTDGSGQIQEIGAQYCHLLGIYIAVMSPISDSRFTLLFWV